MPSSGWQTTDLRSLRYEHKKVLYLERKERKNTIIVMFSKLDNSLGDVLLNELMSLVDAALPKGTGECPSEGNQRGEVAVKHGANHDYEKRDPEQEQVAVTPNLL